MGRGWPLSSWSSGGWKWGTLLSILEVGVEVATGGPSSLTLGLLSSDHIKNKKQRYMKKAYLLVVTHFTARARGSSLPSSLDETAGDHWEKRKRKRKRVYLLVLVCWQRYSVARCCSGCWKKLRQGMSTAAIH